MARLHAMRSTCTRIKGKAHYLIPSVLLYSHCSHFSTLLFSTPLILPTRAPFLKFASEDKRLKAFSRQDLFFNVTFFFLFFFFSGQFQTSFYASTIFLFAFTCAFRMLVDKIMHIDNHCIKVLHKTNLWRRVEVRMSFNRG